MWNWLWQALLGNWIYDLLAIGGAALIAFLRSRKSSLSDPLVYMYGLAALALMVLIGVGARGFYVLGNLLTSSTTITTDNAEPTIKAWLDGAGSLQSRILEPSETPSQDFFVIEGRLMQNGDILRVTRVKDHAEYLVAYANLAIAPEHRQMISKLSAEEQTEVTQVIAADLAAQSRTFSFNLVNGLHVEERAPLSGLTQNELLSSVNKVESAVVFTRNKLLLELERLSKQPIRPDGR